MAIPAKMRLGELLVGAGLITEEQLESALDVGKQTGKRLGYVLMDSGILTETQILDVMRKRLNLEFVRLQGHPIGESVIKLVSEDTAREYTVIPYRLQGDTLYVATADPLDYAALNEVGTEAGKNIEAVVATSADIRHAIETCYSTQNINTIATALSTSALENDEMQLDDIDFEALENRVESVPVVKFVNNMLAQAYIKRASDIHIEPTADYLRIRLRIDGVLSELVRLSIKAHASIVTRIKIMAGMDIAEKRVPLDGRFTVSIENSDISVRSASMPTVYGEKIVLRMMPDAKSGVVPLEDLGFHEANSKRIREAIRMQNGLVLVTGPTGSGKTTTLYSILNELSSSEVNVLTVEDPVEKVVEGVNQTQVNPKAGLNFASGLRAILRQDPDKIMVGEIRDAETADIAARAAITGHLVLASIHTNSAADAYMRLMDMGIEAYIVASSVIAVVAQRLVKLLCPFCKNEHAPSEQERIMLRGMKLSEDEKVFHSEGCPQCNYTGTLGRTAISEVVVTDGTVRSMIVRKAPTEDIQTYLLSDKHLNTMMDDARKLVAEGKISLHELIGMNNVMED